MYLLTSFHSGLETDRNIILSLGCNLPLVDNKLQISDTKLGVEKYKQIL